MSASLSNEKTCFVISIKYNLAGDYLVEQTAEFYKFTLVKPAYEGWHPIGTVTYVLLTEQMGFGDWDKVTADKIAVSEDTQPSRTHPPFAQLAFAVSFDATCPLKHGYYSVQQTETCYLFTLRHPYTSEPALIEEIGKITKIPLTQTMGLDDQYNPFGNFRDVTPDKITIV
jgi:hypothetical protein